MPAGKRHGGTAAFEGGKGRKKVFEPVIFAGYSRRGCTRLLCVRTYNTAPVSGHFTLSVSKHDVFDTLKVLNNSTNLLSELH